LRTLSLAFNPIDSVPSWIGDFPFLEDLNLDGLFAGELPDWLLKLHRLRELKLNACGLRSLPGAFVGLRGLRMLILIE